MVTLLPRTTTALASRRVSTAIPRKRGNKSLEPLHRKVETYNDEMMMRKRTQWMPRNPRFSLSTSAKNLEYLRRRAPLEVRSKEHMKIHKFAIEDGHNKKPKVGYENPPNHFNFHEWMMTVVTQAPQKVLR